jgi:glycosyltransferase involved in cell wall biosynthesis
MQRDDVLDCLISSAGLEYRDYRTLLAATAGLDIDVVIAAASYWSHHGSLAAAVLPPRVQLESFDYQVLRDLYARSRFGVVPLYNGDNQAGITIILEAMSMGKAVIVSHMRGQTGVVRDHSRANRSDSERLTRPEWVRLFGTAESTRTTQADIYEVPNDDGELRRAIVHLLENPDEAQRMPGGWSRKP